MSFCFALIVWLFLNATPRGVAVVHQQGTEIPPGCAVIEGRVVDDAGRPLAGATVYSLAVDHPPRGRLLSTVTDAEGRFSLKCAEPGKNGVSFTQDTDQRPER